MSILKQLAQALEEQDIELSNAQRDAGKWESLYKGMCERNKELIGEKETLQHNIRYMIDTQSQLLSKLKEVTESDNLFTLKADVQNFINGLDFVKGLKV